MTDPATHSPTDSIICSSQAYREVSTCRSAAAAVVHARQVGARRSEIESVLIDLGALENAVTIPEVKRALLGLKTMALLESGAGEKAYATFQRWLSQSIGPSGLGAPLVNDEDVVLAGALAMAEISCDDDSGMSGEVFNSIQIMADNCPRSMSTHAHADVLAMIALTHFVKGNAIPEAFNALMKSESARFGTSSRQPFLRIPRGLKLRFHVEPWKAFSRKIANRIEHQLGPSVRNESAEALSNRRAKALANVKLGPMPAKSSAVGQFREHARPRQN